MRAFLPHHLTLLVPAFIFASFLTGFYQLSRLQNRLVASQSASTDLSSQLASQSARIAELESEDQRVKNQELSNTINQIKNTYQKSVSVYESLSDLKSPPAKFAETYAAAIAFLAQSNYSSASAKLTQLEKDISAEKDKVAATLSMAQGTLSVPTSNTPPGAGYSRQSVSTDVGTFVVSLIAADLGNTKVLVDTASDSDCTNNCPVLPLATYVSRSGAFAGVNGSYFCPASYPTCAGKTNSFDLLAMNKNKHYFNSDNNVYSNNPGVIFGSGYIRFVTAVSQWGRDTGIDSMISNYPLLVFNSNVSFGGDDDPKKGSKGNRSFVANRGSTVFIGVVHSATVAEAARALKALGVENALNLDDGGSTALWSSGYKLGPGRELPNAILFVRK